MLLIVDCKFLKINKLFNYVVIMLVLFYMLSLILFLSGYECIYEVFF